MSFIRHDPAAVSPAVGGYTHGLELSASTRLLFISGQIPERPDSSVPPDFEGQCRAVWDNIVAILASAGMTVENLVKVTTYLTARDQSSANSRIRREYLGAVRPGLTVVVATTLESQWLLEIEAVAAK
jgi:2-iminobutanoate/2-iminopropanoate deaminase